MKKLIGVLSLGSILLLGACGNEDLSKEEEKAIEQTEEPQEKQSPEMNKDQKEKYEYTDAPWWEKEGKDSPDTVEGDSNGATVEEPEEEEELREGAYSSDEEEENYNEWVDHMKERNKENQKELEEFDKTDEGKELREYKDNRDIKGSYDINSND